MRTTGILLVLIGCSGFRSGADVRSPQVSGLQPLEAPEPTEGTYEEDTTDPGTTDPGTTDPGTTDPGTTDPGTTDPGTTDPSTTEPSTGPLQACYPGELEDYTTCLGIVEFTSPPTGYDYPEPLYGSAQYAKPTGFLDLTVEDPTTMLAPNFRLDEIAQEWKGDYAVVQIHAIESLQAVRDDVGVLGVNSGYRSPDYNDGVGGATYSRHMYGDAFDLDPSSVTLDQLADACSDNGAGYTQIYTTHVHCDWRDDTVDDEFFGGGARSALLATAAEGFEAEIVLDGTLLVAPAEGFDEGEPRRRWTAYDASGAVLEVVDVAEYVPHPDAVEVEVDVGGVLVRSLPL